ncbi:hypothetical protein ACE02U_12445 [Shewanella xiamenensis]|uniref:hypothetical protein n=1 Tax=Shewanella xiamenensis TaxID=332186 RepID=UPI0035B91CBB
MEALSWGAVFITDGPNKGRIGNYDDNEFIPDEEYEWDEDSDEEPKGDSFAIVYFGHLFQCQNYHLTPFEYLRPVTIDDLFSRREKLQKSIWVRLLSVMSYLIPMNSQSSCGLKKNLTIA